MAKEAELGALFFIANVDVGLKRRFVTEQFIVVGLVRADGDIERRVQVHPVHVALVVIVAVESIGARVEEFFQRCVVGQIGGLLQQPDGHLEVRVVSRGIGNDL